MKRLKPITDIDEYLASLSVYEARSRQRKMHPLPSRLKLGERIKR